MDFMMVFFISLIFFSILIFTVDILNTRNKKRMGIKEEKTGMFFTVCFKVAKIICIIFLAALISFGVCFGSLRIGYC